MELSYIRRRFKIAVGGALAAAVAAAAGALAAPPAIITYDPRGNVAQICSPTTCAAQGKNCGTIPDGCGNTLSCGPCPVGS